jgi:hypothetical protein
MLYIFDNYMYDNIIMIKLKYIQFILIFFCIYVLNLKNKNVKCVTKDVMYNVIPESEHIKGYDLTKICLMFAPLILLIKKSNSSVPLEHLTSLFSYITFIHLLKTTSTDLPCENLSMSFVISSCIILLYWNIVNKNDIYSTYFYVLLYAIFELSRRNTTTANIINDLLITHFVFYLTKF